MMNTYNFNILNWEEFEEFTKDLLSESIGVSFRSFANGPDAGIDLRFSSYGTSRNIIIQCKRYSSVSSLMSNLKKERLKLEKMHPAPKRYILVVSLELKENRINEIVELFSPFIQSSNDIYTPKQLNSLLHKYRVIERRHYKLWLSSSNVLETLLKSEVINYTGLIKEQIEDTLKTYSPTPSFHDAMKTLRENGFIIIAGEPGVGKTTLANVMSYHLLGDGDFDELIALPRDIGDAVAMISSDPAKKQLFLFDDFLGSNYLDNKLSRREDSVFKTLMESIGHLKSTKALIMTTREYILRQAQQSTAVFKDQDFLDAKYVVDLSVYNKVVKAKILYNHLALSDVPEDHLRYFIQEKIYRKIIQHTNYNPRLIEAINKQKLWKNRTPEEFCNKVIDLFDHPWTLYSDIYVNKIDSKARNTMLVMMSIGRKIRFDYLHRAVVSFDPAMDETQLMRSIDVLEGTFLSTSIDSDNQIIIDVLNPTIHDFITHYYRDHTSSLEKLISSAVYLNQLINPFTPNTESYSYKIKASLSQYTPIVLNDSTRSALRNKILNQWRDLRWIDTSAKLEEFDIFGNISRLSDIADEFADIHDLFRRALSESLVESYIPIQDTRTAIGVIDDYYESEDIPESAVPHLIESLADSLSSYEDFSSLAEIGWRDGVKGYISESVIDKVLAEDYHIDIFNEEVQSRLSDNEEVEAIKDEMSETLDYYGLGINFIDEAYDKWFEPPEDYDQSNFYSRDDDFDYYKDSEFHKDSAVDNLFESLIDR